MDAGADRLPRLPGNPQDDDRDREADDRIADLKTEGDHYRARDHREADEPVDAGVVPVGDQRRARQPASGTQADLSRGLVAEEADDAGGSQGAKVVDRLGVDEAVDRLGAGHAGAGEDRRDDEVAGPALSS